MDEPTEYNDDVVEVGSSEVVVEDSDTNEPEIEGNTDTKPTQRAAPDSNEDLYSDNSQSHPSKEKEPIIDNNDDNEIGDIEIPSITPPKPPPPYNYNEGNLARDLMKFTPNLNRSQGRQLKDRLQYALTSNAVILGEFADGTDEYRLKNYLSHLRATGPYDIEIYKIEKDAEGRVILIQLKETQINKSIPKPEPAPKAIPKPELAPKSILKPEPTPKAIPKPEPTPKKNPIYPYSEKSLAGDFMKLTPNLKSNQIVELKARIQNAFASNAIISGEFSDGTSQYKLKNYITHLRNTGPYIVEIYGMEKNEEGKIVSIQLRETQVD